MEPLKCYRYQDQLDISQRMLMEKLEICSAARLRDLDMQTTFKCQSHAIAQGN